ncbi:MAG: hypothetical protein HZA72_02890 [Candidatus Omnitrophica bacterium]|nr:hypothetical protein [Candidatus Omnitrophota bacterium]
MVDKKIESNIKIVKNFLEFWVKFHSIYSSMASKETISKDEEDKFLQTKELIKNRYDTLKNSLEFKYMPHTRITDPVNDVLFIDGIRFVSEKNLKKVEDDWRDSYIFLNSILERLKNKKRRLEQFNPVGVFIKRFFEEVAK